MLRTVTGTQGATRAIKDGTVAPQRFTLEFEEVPGLIPAFRRMVRGLEFDVCEMAFTTYLCARAYGKPFTALPVFPVRALHHGAIVRGAGPASAGTPKDLEGRRVGVNRGYTVTTGVWARGILQDQYGVDLDRVTWVPSGDEHVAEYVPPPNVTPMQPGGDLAGLVEAGDLAAGIGLPADRPGLRTLIPQAREAGFEALRRDGLYPINHLVVVRDDLLAAHPGLAADLFWAFARAKDRYIQRLSRDESGTQGATDRMYRQVMAITGTDPLPYGIEPNRAMIELLIRHAVSQRIIDRPGPAAGTLFAEGTRDLTA